MTPGYFGASEAPLFGIHHPPLSASRGRAVLLCYPGPQEYLRAHWAFRRLAGLLTREGFDVFRFDYFGTGDSSGESSQGSVARWTEDVRTAAQELEDVSGIKKLSVVGMRLGASLAASACADGLGAEPLVLWDPVVNGKAYLKELERLHEWKVASALYPPAPGPGGRHEELLGFPFPRALEQELEAVDLLKLPRPPSAQVSLVLAGARDDWAALAKRLSSSGAKVQVRQVEEERAPSATLDSALLSQASLNAIVEALKEAGR